jgi:tetratricopeptide (TPR) repeat protein
VSGTSSASPLSKERWQAISPHLDRALELPEPERAAWLASLAAEDPALAADLRELLEDGRVAERKGFLGGGVAGPPATPAGQTLGAYTLVSLIGQGGMGNVWLARRSDGRFEGRAAVKLLNAALVGRTGEERFRREGSILARLTHPYIAHLVDAGVSPSGQPYLVLEYVEGVPIDRYCEKNGLDAEARLRLFLDVLAAVAHAHANLVVHRDIKPSNVLVGHEGQVKLLDFGIAKLLEGDSASGEETALTREGGRALTPEYAAPEQVTGGTVTTATDVYALGTLLYLLLSGRHPAERALGSPAELYRAIADVEAPRLSSTSPGALRRTLKGDLDTIVGKALKKSPAERYPSVTAFAEDLTRYLGHEPIAARPDTLTYRASKFVRRNRGLVALAAAAVLALAGGLVGTLTQARRATRHAALAETERDFALRQLARAESINDLNMFLLSDAAPSGKSFTVGELLDRAERVVEKERGENDENRAELLTAIGLQYWSQDEDAKSRRVLSRAYELARKLPDPSLRAKTACALASAVARGGQAERAEALFREGIAALPDTPVFTIERSSCLLRGSVVARESGDVKTGLERALAAQRLQKDARPASALRDLTVSMDVAESFRMASRHREADAEFQKAFERLSALGRDDTQKAGTLLNNWGLTLHFLGQPLRSAAVLRRAIEISSADGDEGSVSPMLLNNYARELLELKRVPEALQHAERACAAARRAGDEIVVNQSLLVRAAGYLDTHDTAGAARVVAELETRFTRMLPKGHVGFAALAMEQAFLAHARGDSKAAADAANRAVAIAEASSQAADAAPRFLVRRSALDLELVRPEDARADAARALQLELKVAPPGQQSCRVGRAYAALGRAETARGGAEAARAAFAAALPHLESTLGADHPETREARLASEVAKSPGSSAPDRPRRAS